MSTRRAVATAAALLVAVLIVALSALQVLSSRTHASPSPTPTPSPSPSAPAPTVRPAPSVAPSSPAPSISPLAGDLLIADLGNDRLLIVTPEHQVVWSMTVDPGGPLGSASWGPDDAFFTPDGRHIVINEENADTVDVIDIAAHRIVWQYGHTGHAGSAPGYLNGPDDAYMLPDGTIEVADIRNQRILFISRAKTIVRQFGVTDVQRHDPPIAYDAPNGDFPAPGGGTLVTEIGGSWVDRLDASGRLVWSVHLAGIAYPSDAQLLPNGNVLVVDYSSPGAVEELTPKGDVVWRYRVASGPGRLDHPSLAMQLPNGDVVVTDDFGQTVDVIDPATDQIVWQYGHPGLRGHADGYLNNPDGLDPVPPSVAQLIATLPASPPSGTAAPPPSALVPSGSPGSSQAVGSAALASQAVGSAASPSTAP